VQCSRPWAELLCRNRATIARLKPGCLLGVATESGVFSLELCLPFLERVHGSVEVLQICTILSHQVFGTFQQFFRGWTVGRHSGCKDTPLRIQSARKDRHAECPTVRC